MNYTEEQRQSWERTVSIMQEGLAPYVFQTWIAPLQLHTVTADSILLLAESFVQRDTVKQRYYTRPTIRCSSTATWAWGRRT